MGSTNRANHHRGWTRPRRTKDAACAVRAVKHQGKNLKIERNRAARRAAQARRYAVSPVTRAIRSVLTVSAAALAFSGTGLALAKTPSAPSVIAAPRATLSDQALLQIPAQVVDLTVVHDASLPTSVVDGAFDLHAALADPDVQLAAGPGYDGRLDRVLDLTTVQSIVAGPGDGTGTGGDVGYDVRYTDARVTTHDGFTYSASSATGYAVGLFTSGNTGAMEVDNSWDIDATGYTWAAGIETEAGTVGTVDNHGVVTATATGTYGTAVGVYVAAGVSSGVSNDGAIHAIATGTNGNAIGAFGYAAAGDATVTNVGDITATTQAGGYGMAIALAANSVNGDATASSNGTLLADGYNAVGVFAYAMDDGTANAANDGTLVVNGVYESYGVKSMSVYGDAIASNSGDLSSNAYVYGVGIIAEGGNNATATNTGTISAQGSVGAGVGILVVGDQGTTTATNSGTVLADSGYGTAYGIYAVGFNGPTIVTNDIDGSIEATSFQGNARGIYAVGLGDTLTVTNDGTISASATGPNGEALGVLAYGAGVTNIHNTGTIDATGAYASGILAFGIADGASVNVDGTGDITATGEIFASGIEAVSRNYHGTASVTSGGYVDVSSRYGVVQGLVAAADLEASITNTGTVFASGGSAAYGALAISADGDVTVDSANGDIFAYANSRDGVAYAVLAQTNNGHVAVTTGGLTYAIGDNATGIYAGTKWNDIDVTNDGDMVVVGRTGYAEGMHSVNYEGTVTLTNNGSMYVGAGYFGTGMFGASVYGDANVVNNGDLETFGLIYDRGLFARTVAGGTATVENHGDLSATSYVSSYGVWSRSDNGDAVVRNTGDIQSQSYFYYGFGVIVGGATGVDVTNGTGSILGYGGDSFEPGTGLAGAGILAYSRLGDVTIGNAGTIVGAAYGNAAGISASANGNVTIDSTNADGLIGAYSNVGYAVGINASANGNVDVTSAGDIVAHTNAGFAAAIYAIGENVDIDNTGSIDAASASWAYGIQAIGFDTASATNHGDITATVLSGQVYGIYAYGGNAATVLNDGDITAHALTGNAIGMSAFSYGTAKATNCDCAAIDATSDNGGAVGISVYGLDGVVVNDGAINATSYNSSAMGIQAIGYASVDVTTGATGAIHATAYNGRANGIVAFGDVVTIDNGADITAEGDKYAVAIRAEGQYEGSTVSVINSGDLYATVGLGSKYGAAGGINANADGAVSVTNVGSIATQGGILAFGVMAQSGDHANVVHDGDITVHQALAGGFGIRAQGSYGATVDATGDITVLAAKYGAGIIAQAYDGDANVGSGGDLHVTAYGQAVGIVVDSGYGNAHAINTGTITVDGGIEGAGDYVNVTGIQAYAYYGEAAIDNGGTVSVSTLYGDAVGLYAGGHQANITNGGDVNATGGESAIGIAANTYGGDATIVNEGHVTVVQTGGGTQYAPPLAVDLSGNGVGIGATAEYGNVSITHNGAIEVTAHDSATGIYAGAYHGNATVAGTGDITAISENGDATGIVAEADNDYDAVTATVDVGGDIVATSAHNAAEGIWAMADNVEVHSGGSITATGYGWAAGIDAVGDVVNIVNDGAIHASITGSGEYTGAAGIYAYGAASLDIANGGDIVVASANAGAYGVVAYSYVNTVTVANTGSITTTGLAASGIEAWTHGDIAIDNGGDVLVNGTNGAVGILAEGTHVTVANGGTIQATSTGGAAIGMAFHADESIVENTGSILAPMAILGNGGLEDIRNAGLIVGALDLDAGDDVFTNKSGGTWNVLGHVTDFGAGDDTIVNEAGGTIVMHDASISLGYNGAAGNAFANAGTISVLGESFIDMGTGAEPIVTMAPAAPIDVLNPAAFVNDGVIDFVDGNPDDVLTIAGDLGGDGALNVDVSLLNSTSDMLYVDGNLVDDAHQALNVAVLDMPTAGGQILVPVVAVKGESQPGQVTLDSFTIGNVAFSSSNFLDLGVSVVEHLDASNAAADMFALELSFDGINDTGSLAASIAPGAQSLMAAQVGTFRQRFGQWSQPGNGDKGAWVRLYRDKGTINPDSVLFNLPQEDSFAFDQTNTGIEAGIGAHITDGVWIGMSLATGEGKQSLERGVGSDELDGDTIGAHLTWLSTNGMYTDVSYRWMHFDAALSSGAGRQTVGGDAGAFNAEAGWMLGSGDGLKFVPQVQYTHTDVSNVDPVRGDLTDFTTDGVTSERLRAGLELQQTFTTAKGNWTPYGTLSAIREFDGESSFQIGEAFGGRTSTEGTSGMVELGANVNMGQLSFWGGLNFIDGGAIDGVWGGQAGLRYTW